MTKTTIEIAITNLGLYNEGELVYKWLTLPASEEEFSDALKDIRIDGVNYEEYFISDYCAPFNINEYTSISKLNEIAENFENVSEIQFDGSNLVQTLFDIKNLAIDLELDEITEDYFTMDEIEECEIYPKHSNGNVNLSAMIYFLGSINGATEVVRIDGYGNLEEVRMSDLENLYSDLMNAYMTKLS